MLNILNTISIIIFILTLAYVAVNDFRTKKITNRSLQSLLLAGTWATLLLSVSPADRLAGVLLTGAPLLLIDLILPDTFGGGDIKLSAIAGGLLGWKGGLLALCAGFLTGGVYSAMVLLPGKKKRKDRIAFGPFICFGMAISFLF